MAFSDKFSVVHNMSLEQNLKSSTEGGRHDIRRFSAVLNSPIGAQPPQQLRTTLKIRQPSISNSLPPQNKILEN